VKWRRWLSLWNSDRTEPSGWLDTEVVSPVIYKKAGALGFYMCPDQTQHSKCDQTRRACVRSHLTYGDASSCCVENFRMMNSQRTGRWARSGRGTPDASCRIWGALERLWKWPDTGKPKWSVRPVMEWLWRVRVCSSADRHVRSSGRHIRPSLKCGMCG
jgi:hypothetical protein